MKQGVELGQSELFLSPLLLRLPSLSPSLGPPASSEVPFQGESWTPKSVSSDHCALQCSAERDTPSVVWVVHSRRGRLDLAAAGASGSLHGGRRGRNPEGSWNAASTFCPRGQLKPKWRRSQDAEETRFECESHILII